ncbi:MAG: D-alanyl-D-alanine carboxypeptidase [Proteobacteria bacterium]|nr:D-alanyl-D-alanine carboxypeptidase [Pseudomonadota bacterium]
MHAAFSGATLRRMNAESRSTSFSGYTGWLTAFLLCIFLAGSAADLHAASLNDMQRLIGEKDAVLVASPRGRILFEKNAGKKLIPASALKIFTSLVALHYLGPEYRFTTEFYLDRGDNLKIKGYGDPLLLSETVRQAAAALSLRLGGFNDLILDDSFFSGQVRAPGTAPSYQPYDAPNGALCVNFNTVAFKRVNHVYVSDEEQTPLLPFVDKRLRDSSLERGRIVLSHRENEATLYAGHLFKYFLTQAGMKSQGEIRLGRVRHQDDRLLFTYTSPFSIKQSIGKLMEFSNNFMANQLLVACGAKAYGAPGSLDKGVMSALRYAQEVLKTDAVSFVEGSGISRKNELTASVMLKALEFEPYHHLLRQEGEEFFKTGTLDGIRSRAGYIADGKGGLFRFVVIMNTRGKTTDAVMKLIHRELPRIGHR